MLPWQDDGECVSKRFMKLIRYVALSVPVRTALAGRGGEMKIISFIDEYQIIRKTLEHLGLPARMAGQAGGSQKPSRDPPDRDSSEGKNELTYEPFYDD